MNLDAVDASLIGDRVALRPMLPQDIMVFHAAEHTAAPLGVSRLGGRTLPLEKYAESLHMSVLVAVSVVATDTGDLVGYGLCYDADFVSDRARFAVMTLPGHRGSPLSMNGIELFLRYLFTWFPFRSLYADVFEPNLAQFASAERAGLLERQGTFPEYQYWRGGYVAMTTFRVTRGAVEAYVAARPAANAAARPIPATFDEFSSLVADGFGCEPPGRDTVIADAGFDSLDLVEFALWCEEYCGTALDIGDATAFGEIHEMLQQSAAAHRPG